MKLPGKLAKTLTQLITAVKKVQDIFLMSENRSYHGQEMEKKLASRGHFLTYLPIPLKLTLFGYRKDFVVIVKVISSTVIGIESHRVDVEVYISTGLPVFSIVGLPDVAVRESKDRTKAAVKNAGYRFPRHHVTVNLAPADIKKEGTGFDLPIAIGILAAEEIMPAGRLSHYCFMGELSLDGGIKGVQGILSAAIQAKEDGLRGIVVPRENAEEAAMVQGIDVIPASSLPEILEFFNDRMIIEPFDLDVAEIFRNNARYEFDYQEIQGQELAKRALEIAAAGGHNVLMLYIV